MANDTSQDIGRSQFDRNNGRRYVQEFLPAMIAYALLIVVLVTTIDLETAGAWKYAAMLTPLIPWLFAARAVIRHLQRIDERERDVQVTGMSFGFAAAVGLAFILGFLSIAGLETDPWGPWVIFSAAMATWAVASGWQTACR